MNQMIIPKLKKWIEPLSVNQIKSISPKFLKVELQISDKELLEVVKFLYDERVLKYRYKFKCDVCGNDCIAYERVLKVGEYTCSVCGKYFSLEEVNEGSQVVYEFNKTEMLEVGTSGEINFTKAAFGSKVVSIKEHRGKMEGEVRMEDKKKIIFFGSSKESANTMDEVAALVGSLGCSTIRWNSPNSGVFIAGDSTLDSLISATKQVDGAIFIFNDDDKIWCRDEIARGTVRDNVLFEYGLFMGSLGKTKVAFVSKNRPKLASDLVGVTYIDANNDEAVVSQSLKNWLNRI
jgi:predicted nucleotide-binding protein